MDIFREFLYPRFSSHQLLTATHDPWNPLGQGTVCLALCPPHPLGCACIAVPRLVDAAL